MTKKMLLIFTATFFLTFVIRAQDEPDNVVGGDDEIAEEAVEKVEDTEKDIEEPDAAVEEKEEAEKPEIPEPSIKKEVVEAAGKETGEEKPSEPSILAKIGHAVLFYIPNRILDVTDIFSGDVGLGPEFGLEVRVTRYLQYGGLYGDKYFLTKGYARQYGGGYSAGWNFQNTCWSAEDRYVEDTFGSVKDYVIEENELKLASFEHHVYKDDIRDFCEIGLRAGWLFPFGFAVHPVEIFDIPLGCLFIDIRGDDL